MSDSLERRQLLLESSVHEHHAAVLRVLEALGQQLEEVVGGRGNKHKRTVELEQRLIDIGSRLEGLEHGLSEVMRLVKARGEGGWVRRMEQMESRVSALEKGLLRAEEVRVRLCSVDSMKAELVDTQSQVGLMQRSMRSESDKHLQRFSKMAQAIANLEARPSGERMRAEIEELHKGLRELSELMAMPRGRVCELIGAAPVEDKCSDLLSLSESTAKLLQQQREQFEKIKVPRIKSSCYQ
jgi:hypothetical protein